MSGIHFGGSGMAGNTPASMPLDDVGQLVPTRCSTSSSSASSTRVELRPEERVLGAHRRLGQPERALAPRRRRPAAGTAGRPSVGSSAETRAELVRLARLVVGDDERAVGQLVDAIDLAAEADAPAVGEHQLDALVVAERLLGRQHLAPGPADAVERQPRVEGGQQLGPGVDPVRRPAGAPGAWRASATSAPARCRARGVLVGPARRPRLGERAGEHGVVEPVDGVVDGGAAVERAERLDVRRLVDRADAEEVAARSRRAGTPPTSRAGRRDGRRQRGDGAAVRSPSNSVNSALARASRRRSARRRSTSSVRQRQVADVVAGAGARPQLAQAVLGRPTRGTRWPRARGRGSR